MDNKINDIISPLYHRQDLMDIFQELSLTECLLHHTLYGINESRSETHEPIHFLVVNHPVFKGESVLQDNILYFNIAQFYSDTVPSTIISMYEKNLLTTPPKAELDILGETLHELKSNIATQILNIIDNTQVPKVITEFKEKQNNTFIDYLTDCGINRYNIGIVHYKTPLSQIIREIEQEQKTANNFLKTLHSYDTASIEIENASRKNLIEELKNTIDNIGNITHYNSKFVPLQSTKNPNFQRISQAVENKSLDFSQKLKDAYNSIVENTDVTSDKKIVNFIVSSDYLKENVDIEKMLNIGTLYFSVLNSRIFDEKTIDQQKNIISFMTESAAKYAEKKNDEAGNINYGHSLLVKYEKNPALIQYNTLALHINSIKNNSYCPKHYIEQLKTVIPLITDLPSDLKEVEKILLGYQKRYSTATHKREKELSQLYKNILPSFEAAIINAAIQKHTGGLPNQALPKKIKKI